MELFVINTLTATIAVISAVWLFAPNTLPPSLTCAELRELITCAVSRAALADTRATADIALLPIPAKRYTVGVFITDTGATSACSMATAHDVAAITREAGITHTNARVDGRFSAVDARRVTVNAHPASVAVNTAWLFQRQAGTLAAIITVWLTRAVSVLAAITVPARVTQTLLLRSLALTAAATVLVVSWAAAHITKLAPEALTVEDAAVTRVVDACANVVAHQVTAVTVVAGLTHANTRVHWLLYPIDTRLITSGAHPVGSTPCASCLHCAVLKLNRLAGASPIAVKQAVWDIASNPTPTWLAGALAGRLIALAVSAARKRQTTKQLHDCTINNVHGAVRSWTPRNVANGAAVPKVEITLAHIVNALAIPSAYAVATDPREARITNTADFRALKYTIDAGQRAVGTCVVRFANALERLRITGTVAIARCFTRAQSHIASNTTPSSITSTLALGRVANSMSTAINAVSGTAGKAAHLSAPRITDLRIEAVALTINDDTVPSALQVAALS